eukprot:CAMPEP_0204611154 /NCGR_PEP_ID=MMETSP0661-20131031/61878_1 /ASSEMBLY_ACC=CAM_ASM_000606 /TAXON_ID=109239 /ORGANISM="Alexandrium margalefi, Strain AMGDE01CS-322" /LENGTH=287 /DNA_ID=CAMNT_0051622997 /DNA_START=52 /DNA_END=916 /DNA_ORIENTATION=+
MAPLRAVLVLALLGAAAATNAEGKAFLEAKEKEEGVVKLASGLLYKVLKKGEGKHHPTVDSPCDCHYAGTLIDGTEFDSSYKRGQPTTFAPEQVIKGWTEAMQLMVEGDKWEMYIPSELAYGDRGAGGRIPGGAALVFQMELMKIKGSKVEKKADLERRLPFAQRAVALAVLCRRQRVIILRGAGWPARAIDWTIVSKARDARVPTGADSSYKRGQPTTFAPEQVIKGWTEAMQLMVEGDKWEMYIPSELAYGDRGAGGRIPGGAALVFQMELMKIKGSKVEKKADL